MANYFYKWTPLLILGTIVLLGLPWLGLIALIFLSFVLFSALSTLALAITRAAGALSRAISHRWHGRTGSTLGVTPALSPVSSGYPPAQDA